MYKLSLLLLLTFFTCNKKVAEEISFIPLSTVENQIVNRIAFGSCNKQNGNQQMWQYIIQNNPDLWIWLGDNIYADTEDMELMAQKYNLQKSHPEYQALLKNCPVIGIWDDHDYGVNDGGKEYPKKEESKKLMLDFMDVPEEAAVSKRRHGAYQSYVLGPATKQVKVILLDARYFRDELVHDTTKGRRYKANPSGDILGEEQWEWLGKELRESEAAIHIIGCGIQFIPEEHGWEKWANFPKARKRFFDLLVSTKPANPLLISGDRHISEISGIQLDGLSHPLYEVTSSSLTHAWSGVNVETNQYRVGEMINQNNFAILDIDWEAENPRMTISIKGLNDELFLEETLKIAD